MNYKRIYDEFISDRSSKQDIKGYFETHHILPRSLDGTDEQNNLIKLTASDHLFAHALLARIYKDKMISALFLMNGKNIYTNRSKRLHYEYCKKNVVISEETINKISESCKKLDTSHLIGNKHFQNKKHTKESKLKMSKSKIGKKFSPEHKIALSKAHSRKKVVVQYDIDLKEINRFESLTKAAESINSSKANLHKKVDVNKTYKGYYWKYENNLTLIID